MIIYLLRLFRKHVSVADMSCIVQKFGGTSVADIDCIKMAAKRVVGAYNSGNQMVVVVSAMAGVTNNLIELTEQVNGIFDVREYDVILSSGEQTNAGLMALAIQDLGIQARSWLGWQLPIKTDSKYGRARITEIDISEIKKRIENNEVAIVPGFQGLSKENRITTLGRGGSDLTAVAIAGALNADRCEIYTDVDGIYTCDPRIVSKAKKLDKVTYEEMLELASQGARVLQARSVELAKNHGVRVEVKSAFTDTPGTQVVSEDEILEKEVVSGISYSSDEAKITLRRVKDQPGVAAGIFGPLADASVNVDMIVQNVSEDGKTTDLTFTVTAKDLNHAKEVLSEKKSKIGFDELVSDSNLSKISIVGVGMRSNTGVAKTMFNTLAKKNINIKVISTSEIKISVLIDTEYTELALRALHSAYGLDQ